MAEREDRIPEILQWNLRAFRSRYPRLSVPPPSAAPALTRPGTASSSAPLRQWLQTERSSSRAVLFVGLPPRLEEEYVEILSHPHSGLVLLEPSWEALLQRLAQNDLRELILSPYVFWLAGENWAEQLSDLIGSQGMFQIPPQAFYMESFLAESEGPSPAEVRQRMAQVSRRELQSLSETIQAYRPRPAPPLRIWAHVEEKAAVYNRLTRSLMRGFESLGCEVRLSRFHREWLVQEKTCAEWVRFSPDLCFFLNGPSAPILRRLGIRDVLLKQMGARRLTWYVDQPRFLAPFSDAPWACAEDDAAVVDRTYREELEKMRPRSLFSLPASTTLDRRGKTKNHFRFPLVYVGSICDIRSSLDALPTPQRDLLEHLLLLRSGIPTFSLQEFLKEVHPPHDQMQGLLENARDYNIRHMKSRFHTPEDSLEYFLYVTSTFRKRLAMAQALLPRGLHIYGPNDWYALADEKYHHQLHGLVSSEDLPDCYASALININVHSLQCPTCLNIRDFDVPRAGGFLLSDWVEEIEEGLLEDRVHCAVYRTVDELQEKVDYYLSRPEECMAIAETGCERVLERHTPRHRAETILNTLYPKVGQEAS